MHALRSDAVPASTSVSAWLMSTLTFCMSGTAENSTMFTQWPGEASAVQQVQTSAWGGNVIGNVSPEPVYRAEMLWVWK